MSSSRNYGNEVTYNKGTFKVGADWSVSDSAITFTPFIYVGTKGGFAKDHELHFTFPGQGDYTKRTYEDIHEKGTYYFKPLTWTKKQKVTQEYTKKGKSKYHTVYEKVDTSGAQYSYAADSVTINAWLANTNGKSKSGVSTLVLVSPLTPLAPEGVTAEVSGYSTNNNVVIRVDKIQATPTRIVTGWRFERLTDTTTGSNWSTIHTVTNQNLVSTLQGYDDRLYVSDGDLTPGARYLYRVVAVNANGEAASQSSAWVYASPPPVENVSSVRLDDGHNRIYFSRNAKYITLSTITQFHFEYNSLDIANPEFDSGWNPLEANDWENYNINKDQQGGIYTQQYDDVAITHKTCQKDTRYRYRIYTQNAAGYSSFQPTNGTETLFNTPLKPSKLQATPNFEGTEVTLKIQASFPKNNTTADKLLIKRKEEGGDWVYIPSSDGVALSSLDYSYYGGIPTYTYIDSDILEILGKKVYYKCYFVCSYVTINGQTIDPPYANHGLSDESEPVDLLLLSKPNKPNLIMPVNNAKIESSTQYVRLAWTHSPKDGTSQKSAELQYKRARDEEWTNVTIEDGTKAYYDLPVNSIFSPNDEVTWRVRTKGEHPEFSDYNEHTFKVLHKPVATITTIDNLDEISHLPLVVGWTYEDLSGTLEKVKMEIYYYDELDRTIDIDPATLETENQYVLKDYLFIDAARYSIKLLLISTSGMDTTTAVTFSIAYEQMMLTNGFSLVPSFDPDTGFCTLSVQRTLDPGQESEDEGIVRSDARVKQFYVYRIFENEFELVLQQDVRLEDYNEKSGYDFTDLYAPINIEYEYKLLQVTELGEVSVSYSSIMYNESLWWYIYYGDTEIIKVKWNPQGSVSLGRPQRQEVRYSGREYPVIYDSSANEETYSLSFALLGENVDEGSGEPSGKEVLQQLKEFMRLGGVGIWKSFEGDVYYAKFDFSYNANYAEIAIPMWNCSLNITRIEEEGREVI